MTVPISTPSAATLKGFPFGKIGTWIFAAQAVEVEVDEATGRITPLKIWSAHDIGKAINPTAVEGQIQGGIVQGLGYALCEEMVWDSGRLANPSFMDYKIPGIMDVPPEIETMLVEDPDEDGPFGAKGIGEPPIVGRRASDLQRGRARHRDPAQTPADDAGTRAARLAGVAGVNSRWPRR